MVQVFQTRGLGHLSTFFPNCLSFRIVLKPLKVEGRGMGQTAQNNCEIFS